MNSVLSLRNVTRVYLSGERSITVLDHVDLDIRAREIVGLVGPSGSGKSSLLHIAGLLERPTEGEVFIDGEEAWTRSEDARTALRRAKIGFVYQFHNLLPEFDALENVALPRLIAGGAARIARAEASRLLTLVGLEERMHHRPAQLSGGEQQRVAIARALINHPVLLLADEPTGNLDPTTSRQVFSALAEITRREGAATLIATHNLELTKSMDRALVLRDHKLVERSMAV